MSRSYSTRDARLPALVAAYQSPVTRAAAWDSLCHELRSLRSWLPSRVGWQFDPSPAQGEREALAAVDLALADVLLRADPARPQLAGWIYLQVRNQIRQRKRPILCEFAEEGVASDESREIDEPEGIDGELRELWHRRLDPFVWLDRHRGRAIKEIDYQILLRCSRGCSYEQIGRELCTSGDAVRKRVDRLRQRLLSSDSR